MITDFGSPNHGERRPERGSAPVIDTLVIHYTGMMPTLRARDWLCDPVSKVSAHYLLAEDGTTWRLVEEDRRAWHAGVGCWRGWRDINSRSIGIELSNPGHDYGYTDFPDAQIEVLIALARDILARHPIPARNVVAHSDIAPERKIDPGERFPWPRLAAAGIGLWPDETASAPAAGDVSTVLGEIGYDVIEYDLATVLSAFQRRFRPARFDGELDDETRSRISAVNSLVAGPATSA
ncbi:MAG: N-acetylmuramoyl-L-alanine amidase [Alphaproteobacteria bacterium]|nr:N-acetylmuramoyl-L-alanine amidase [Alphaproteobacteria bacterium]